MNKILPPLTDFRAVRDGRNSQVFYIDVALDTARSVSSGTQTVLNISGNSFYCDANPTDGNCVVHFQDTNFDRGPVPLYVSPGVIFNIPYTKILLENTAQPGKRVRLVYGVDVDFQPGSVAQIAVTNSGGFSSIRTEAATGSFASVAGLAAYTPETIIAPSANINGAVVLTAGFTVVNYTAFPWASIISKSSPPTTHIDGSILTTAEYVTTSGYFMECGNISVPQFLAAGQGLYFISGSGIAVNSVKHARYKLL